MTLDKAIKHEKELSEENYLQGMLCHANPNDEELDGYIERGRYHEQLAEWMKKLQEYENKNSYQKYVDNIASTLVDAIENLSIEDIDMYKIGYNKAIDDFVKNLYKIGEYKDFGWEDIFKLADQLKSGDMHDR